MDYLENGEFVGADIARKYLQMGYTPARRYNYKGGKKYDETQDYSLLERGTGEQEKAEATKVFNRYWKLAEANQGYCVQKKDWKKARG